MERITHSLLAKKLGVSKMTISLALRNSYQVSETMRAKVHRLANELGYEHNNKVSKLMKSLKKGNLKDTYDPIAVLNLTNKKICTEKKQGAEEVAKRAGYYLEEFTLGKSFTTFERLEKLLLNRNIKGILLFSDLMNEKINEAKLKNFKIIMQGSSFPRILAPRVLTNVTQSYLEIFKRISARATKKIGILFPAHASTFYKSCLYGAITSTIDQTKIKISYFDQHNESFTDHEQLRSWFLKEMPDVFISFIPDMHCKIENLVNIKFPHDCKYIEMPISSEKKDVSGMHLDQKKIGSLMVASVVGMIESDSNYELLGEHDLMINLTWHKGKTF